MPYCGGNTFRSREIMSVENTEYINRSNKKTKRLGKPAGIAIFWGLGLILALVLINHHNPLADQVTERMKKVSGCVLITFTCVIFALYYERIMTIPAELFQSRKLIWKLAKNDFKKRYAGSYLGIVWAMAQPVVTVVMYWIVFDKVFDTRSQMVASGLEVPYVLYLTAGLVPWFYFSEAITQGTMALIEYNYPVKKVVFNISILPIIKVIAATFIHLFFVGILLLVAVCYGYTPTIYTVQLLYYSLCLVFFVLALSYLTSALVVFIRDLQQVISIALQIGMWATPIMWNIKMLPSDNMKTLFKLNPLVYIVNGYRSAIFEEEWFWEHFYSSTYFWIFTISMFCIGTLVFRRLRSHFADVL